jgi:hypothetical protein
VDKKGNEHLLAHGRGEGYCNYTRLLLGWDCRRGTFFAERSLSACVTTLVFSTRTGEQVVINNKIRAATPISSCPNGAHSHRHPVVMKTVGPFTKMQTALKQSQIITCWLFVMCVGLQFKMVAVYYRF